MTGLPIVRVVVGVLGVALLLLVALLVVLLRGCLVGLGVGVVWRGVCGDRGILRVRVCVGIVLWLVISHVRGQGVFGRACVGYRGLPRE